MGPDVPPPIPRSFPSPCYPLWSCYTLPSLSLSLSRSLEAAPHLPADKCKTKTRLPFTFLPPRVNTELQQVRSLNEHTFSPHTIAVRESCLCVAATIEKMPRLPLLFPWKWDESAPAQLRLVSFETRNKPTKSSDASLFTGFKFAVVSLPIVCLPEKRIIHSRRRTREEEIIRSITFRWLSRVNSK